MINTKFLDYCLLLFAVMLFAGLFTVNKYFISVYNYPFTISLIRILTAGIILGFINYKKLIQQVIKAPLVVKVNLILNGVIGIFLGQALFYYSLKLINANTSSVLENFYTVGVFIYSYAVFHTRFQKMEIIGLIITLIGIFIVVVTKSHHCTGHACGNLTNLIYGEILGLGGALAYAYYFIAARYMAQNKFDIKSFLAISYLIASVFLFVLSIQEHNGLTNLFHSLIILFSKPKLIACTIYNVFFASILMFYLFARSVKILGEIKSSILINLAPVFTTVQSAVFLKEIPNLQFILGGVICIIGVMMVTLQKNFK